MPTHRLRQLRGCLVAAAVLVALVAGGAVAGQAGASRLQQRIDAAKAHERALAGALAAQNGRVHQIQGTLAPLLRCSTALDIQRLRNNLYGGKPGAESSRRTLKDKLNLCPDGTQFPGRQGQKVFVLEPDFARARLLQTHKTPRQGGFA